MASALVPNIGASPHQHTPRPPPTLPHTHTHSAEHRQAQNLQHAQADEMHVDQYDKVMQTYTHTTLQPVTQTYICLCAEPAACQLPSMSCDRAPGDDATAITQCP